MEEFPCVDKAQCKYAGTNQGCIESVHHVFYPSYEYRDALSHAFRNLGQNKELMCRRLHDVVHQEESAPEKPDREFMLDAVEEAIALGAITLSVNRRKKIYGNLRAS